MNGTRAGKDKNDQAKSVVKLAARKSNFLSIEKRKGDKKK